MEAEATVEAAGNHRGQPGEVRWLQHEHTNADQRSSTEPSLSVDLLHGRPGGMNDISDRLRHVVEMVAGLLAADGGALVLVNQDGAVRSAIATSRPAYLLAHIEQDLGEGPGLDARNAGQPVAADDVGIGLRWLQLGPVAAGHGVRAVLAAPLRVDGRTVGALTVITATPRRWSEAETQAISSHTSILGQLLATAADADGQRHRASQLQQALDTRVVIEQAKGVLMERNGLFPSQAFELLRRLARSSQRRIVNVAADIVTTSRP